jgi:hypothetical protein
MKCRRLQRILRPPHSRIHAQQRLQRILRPPHSRIHAQQPKA